VSAAPRVLVADDDPAVRGVLRAMLRRGDYQVTEVEDGRAALECFERDGADLILSDLQMPRMSGLELLRHIKQKYSHPPPVVMMVTAYGDEENYNQAMKLGADDFLTKPLDFSKLKEKLKPIA